MKIISDSQYREYKEAMEVLISKGTELGDMELLSESDKKEFIRLTDAIYEWETAYHPLPGKVSTLITDAIKEKMKEKNLNQNEVAKRLGVSKSRISELLSGRRSLNLNLVKGLRDNFGIPADFILDNM
ncbi:helix-turn-helix domain-containing protein [uncultured Bacteroides sp.]|jgi:HTH-type transcriptional regulator/antitoxin HigA|uniref:helix-turn-helix domain-containing protein n=1 Tax=uncultured Bacteroides sp. TaxID=162156 RepID=UPI00206C01D7|nr:helix-turn-helix domain-containing protein [uncultured Bacteroides sp.]DAR49987.1 MAG TPA: Helix-turn-helix XRE-family like protein [Caudoviricetes sp.]